MDKTSDRWALINCSGKKFNCPWTALDRYPDSTLGNPNLRQYLYDKDKGEFFLDRHTASFEAIFEHVYIRNAPLKIPEDVHLDIFLEEIRFYRLPESVIELFLINEGLLQIEDDQSDKPVYKFLPRIRTEIWSLFEDRTSSKFSAVMSLWSMFTIVLSVLCVCYGTYGSFMCYCEQLKNSTWIPGFISTSTKTWLFTCCHVHLLVENACIAWFSLELILRFASTPSIKKFFKSALNMIDMLTILPSAVAIIFFSKSVVSCRCDCSSELIKCNDISAYHHNSWAAIIFRLIKIGRVARILKLSRHSRALRILAKTIYYSLDVFLLIILFHVMMVFMFATFIYLIDAGEAKSKSHDHIHDHVSFVTCPVRSYWDALWWASMTLTTG